MTALSRLAQTVRRVQHGFQEMQIEAEKILQTKSAGNALRDISRKYAALVRAELNTWDTDDPRVAQTYALAAKFL
jgi:hypothetical protein